MILRLNGKVDGDRIELERDTGLPPGTPVSVQIESEGVPQADAHDGIMALCGVWKDDDEIAEIFARILRERELRPCRDVDFDAPS